MDKILEALINQMNEKLKDDTISIEARNLLVKIRDELKEFLKTHDFRDLNDTHELNHLMEKYSKELNELTEKENQCSVMEKS